MYLKNLRPVLPNHSQYKPRKNVRLHNVHVGTRSIDSSSVRFFDEESVLKQSQNRVYKHSKKGQPAVEVKRYTLLTVIITRLTFRMHSRFEPL